MRGRKRRNDIASREFDNVVHMYRKEGASLKQIASFYDVTPYVVRDVLVGMGVEIGPRGRPRIKPLEYDEQKQNEIDMEAFAQEDRDVKKLTSPKIPEQYGEEHQYKKDDLFDLGDFRRPLGEDNA